MRNRWFSRGAITLHVVMLLAVAAMMALFVWQLRRALGGHVQSWAYAVQWPAFACYAVYMWWKLVHDQPGFEQRRPDPALVEAARAEQADEDLGPGPRHVPGPDSPPDGMTTMPRRLRRAR